MPDREKVIKGLKQFITDFKPFCGNKSDWQRVDDALALLQAQEPVEERLNLCESCTKEFAECETDKSDLVFGSGIGNDNIIGCLRYVNRWKAQEPVKPRAEETSLTFLYGEKYSNHFCGECGEVLSNGQKYCPECGRKVKADG